MNRQLCSWHNQSAVQTGTHNKNMDVRKSRVCDWCVISWFGVDTTRCLTHLIKVCSYLSSLIASLLFVQLWNEVLTPGICPVTGTKTGMGSSQSPPSPPLPGVYCPFLYFSSSGFLSYNTLAFGVNCLQKHRFYKPSSHKHSLAGKKLWQGCWNHSGAVMATVSGHSCASVVEDWGICWKG